VDLELVFLAPPHRLGVLLGLGVLYPHSLVDFDPPVVVPEGVLGLVVDWVGDLAVH